MGRRQKSSADQMKDIDEAVGKRPSAIGQAVPQAHGPEQSRRAALSSSPPVKFSLRETAKPI